MNKSDSPRIVIIGAGAVGSLLGGLLAKNGHNVLLIGRTDHIASINGNGLQIDGISGEFAIPVKAATSLKCRPDVVFLAVKSQDVESACREIAPFVKDIPVCTLQNGLQSDAIAGKILGENTIIGGVVMFNARYRHPGHVTYGSKGSLLLGKVSGNNDERVSAVHALLNGIIPTTLSGNIAGARRSKLLVNILGNSMDALTGEPLNICMKSPVVRKIAVRILKEALTVLEKTGVRLEPLPGVPLGQLKAVIKSPLPIASRLLKQASGKITTTSSTLQSLQRGKPTEIDFLNGEIVRLGKTVHVATPFNTRVVECIRTIEQTGRFYSPPELNQIFS